MFIDLVDARIGRAELDHLRADLRDEAAIRGAAGRRQLGVGASLGLDRGRQRIAEFAARGQEGQAADGPFEVVVEAVLVQYRMHALLQPLDRARGGETEVEVDHAFARNHVRRAGAGMDVRHLPRGRRIVFVALVPLDRGQFGQCRHGQVDRVLRHVRIGDVALHAVDHQLAGHGAAAAVLDHVADLLHRGRFADDAVVELFAACLQLIADDHGAVDGRAFFVAGDQEADRAPVVRMRCDEFLDGDHHRRQRGLHVGRAASVQLAVAMGRREGIGGPLRERAGRHHVGMAGEHQQRLRAAAPRPQVGHVAGRDGLAGEAERRQPFGHLQLAAAVGRRDGVQRDQFFGQREGLAHACRVFSYWVGSKPTST